MIREFFTVQGDEVVLRSKVLIGREVNLVEWPLEEFPQLARHPVVPNEQLSEGKACT